MNKAQGAHQSTQDSDSNSNAKHYQIKQEIFENTDLICTIPSHDIQLQVWNLITPLIKDNLLFKIENFDGDQNDEISLSA